MKIRIAIMATTLMLGCTLVQAQSSPEIESKYKKSVDVYSVSETLWMSPSYDSQGQVCMMRVFPKAVSETVTYVGSSLNLDETLKFMNEVFPVHTRGRREEGAGLSDFGGGMVWTSFNFEHVQFVFLSTFRITKPGDKKVQGEVGVDFPVDEAAVAESKRREAMKSDEDLIREYAQNKKVLEIIWANRKCAKP